MLGVSILQPHSHPSTILKKQIFLLGLSLSGRALGQAPSVQDQLTSLQQLVRDQQTQHQQEIDALKKQLAEQQALIAALQKATASPAPPPLPANTAPPAAANQLGGPPPPSTPLFPTTDDSVVPSLPAPPPPSANGAAPAAGAIPTTDASVVATPATGTAPITLAGGGRSYLNVSFDALITGAWSSARDLDRIEVGDHDPMQRGFNARNLELAFDGAVDPYFEAFANIVFKLDSQNETEVEVEEAFAQTTSLPWGLQLKAGQFFAPLGRMNATHPHTWDFVDAPLVQGRLLGPDGLRGVGVQASWVLPTPWYAQLIFAVQNGEGGTASAFRNLGEDGTLFGRDTIDRQLRGAQDLLFVPRFETSVDFSSTRTLLLGASGAFGPNDTGPDTHTQIYAVDAFYKWKPSNAEGGYPYVKWQTEALWRRAEVGRGLDDSFPVRETLEDWGAYSQVQWGFAKGWAAGVRGDYLHMDNSEFTDDPDRQTRWRASADITWYPSEFSKLRLQYNHDWLEASHFLDARSVDSVFLQFEFTIGAHGAHKF